MKTTLLVGWLLAVIAWLSYPLQSYAQNRTIRGKVVSATDQSPLAGATVLVKGTTTGTTTDASGEYTLNLPPDARILVFSFIGFLAQEIEIGTQTTLDVALVEDLQKLKEVVVIGYGSQEKKELASAVGVASRKDFGEVNVSSVGQLIQGKIAGVQVINQSGLPGDNVRIAVRGAGTFTNLNPLYVIDGIQGGDINSVSPYDIEDITVLKDASAVAIYGSSGANGVVIITTKRGKSGKPRITYDGYVGVANAWKKLDMLNASQYIDLVKDIAAAQNTVLPPKLNTPDVLVDRTNWQDEIFRNASVSEHFINMNGGTENLTYSVSLGYTNQDAIMIGYNFKRYTFRTALEQKVGKRIRLGQTLNLRNSNREGQPPSFIDALRMPPYAPTRDPDNLGGFSKVTTIQDLNDAFNPLTAVYLTEQKARSLSTLLQLYGEVDIIEGLRYRAQSSLQIGVDHFYYYGLPNQNGNLTNPRNLTENYGWGYFPLVENILTYDKRFGQHKITALVGNTYANGGRYRTASMSGADFPNDELRHIGAAPTNRVTGGSSGIGTTRVSYFARLNYIFNDRYILTLSGRRDASSVFGPNNRIGYFPSVAAAWRISEEKFFKDISFISDLKLRASWGILGNDFIPPFVDRPFVWRGNGGSNTVVYTLGDGKVTNLGATVVTVPNPNLKWEETTQTDIGFDLAMFNNQLTIGFDYYNRNSRDLLVFVPLPISTGLGAPFENQPSVLSNAGNVVNKGFELTLGYRGQAGDFTYSVNTNIARNINEVISVGVEGGSISSGGFDGVASMTRTQAGHPLGAFYGYRVDRVVSTAAEAVSLAERQLGIQAGDILFQDLNGDGKVDDADQTFLGSPIPGWNYGANINLGYKGFDLMMSFVGVADVQTVNALKYWTEGTTRPFNSSTAVLSRWRKDGDVTNMPRAGQNANGNLNLRPSDRYVESGAFTRLRNLTVGYTLPTAILEKTQFIRNVRVYVTAQNLLTFTKYSGYDPEVSASNNEDRAFLFNRGIDRGQFPQPRTFMLGFQVGF
jgi:TonB-linked SusC/RagA family outer membrane protein